MRLGALSLAIASLCSLATTLPAQFPVRGAVISGKIDSFEIDDPSDPWSSGVMVVAGQRVILPRNLILDLPANRLSLQQLYEDAPARNRVAGETGLAATDTTALGAGFASILANRNAFGNVIAGEVHIEKGIEVVTGVVTYIDHHDGYLRIDGTPGDPGTGTMIRINDPTGRYTIQQGLGVDGAVHPAPDNGSPDIRFGVDPDNYTITFTTGYPAGIPSTVPVGLRDGYRPGVDNASAASDANGRNDPFCPHTNRGQPLAADSRRFAPIQVGDSINAEGNWEDVAGVRFISAHTLTVLVSIGTRNTTNQPDYMIFDEVEWDIPGFQNQRCRCLFIGFTTLDDSLVDLYSINFDPNTGEPHERILASTVNNPDFVNQGLVGTGGGIFKIRYDLDFIEAGAGNISARRSPAQTLINAGYSSAVPGGATSYADNFAIMSPVCRDMIGRTRHSRTLVPGTETRDVNGNQSTHGQYLNPVGLGHPEFVEIDLAALTTPFVFEGIPWNLDRRLGPGGFDGETTPQPLDPFPVSGLNPNTQTPTPPPNIADRTSAYYPFGPSDKLSVTPTVPAPLPIAPARLASPQSLPPIAVVSTSFERGLRGDGNLSVFALAPAGQAVQATLPTGIVASLTERSPGHYFANIPFRATQFAPEVSVHSASNLALAPSIQRVVDQVTIKSVAYATTRNTLSLLAATSDGRPLTSLEAFDQDGRSLGILVGGALTLVTTEVPSSVTVRSSSGGSDTQAVAIVGLNKPR